ncbi:MAG: hypothetical protein ABWX74_14095 [Aeromicrobium sp.]
METMTTTPATESPLPHRRVRADLAAGIVLLTTVIGGHLLWQVSDTGILSALGGH